MNGWGQRTHREIWARTVKYGHFFAVTLYVELWPEGRLLQRLSNGSNGCRPAVRGCSHLTAIGELQPSLAAGMKMGLHICILIGLYLQVLSFLVLARWREWLSLLFEWGSDRVGGTEVGGRLGGGATARGARCTVVVAEVMGLILTPPPCYPHHR